MNWDDPTARAALAESVGAAEYNRQFAAHQRASTVATVGRHAIRPVQTRFGRLYAVGDTGTAFTTQAAAEEYAAVTP